jgi:hypothetical protein
VVDRIRPWHDNPWNWQYRGAPTLLLGGSVEDNLFPAPDLAAHLDLLVSCGGNYVRNARSSRDPGNAWPFARAGDGQFDLERPDEEYWRRFADLLRLTHERGWSCRSSCGTGSTATATRGVTTRSTRGTTSTTVPAQRHLRSVRLLADTVSVWQADPRDDLLAGGTSRPLPGEARGPFYAVLLPAGGSVRCEVSGLAVDPVVPWPKVDAARWREPRRMDRSGPSVELVAPSGSLSVALVQPS